MFDLPHMRRHLLVLFQIHIIIVPNELLGCREAKDLFINVLEYILSNIQCG